MRPTFLLVLLLLASAPAAAQVSGRVADERGGPVAGAVVELWAGLARTGRTVSGADGAFGFDAAAARGATSVRVSRLGYEPAALAVDGPAEGLSVRLRPAPLALAPVTGTARRRRMCPNRENRAARALWEAMRIHYPAPHPLPPALLRTDRFQASVPFGQIGQVEGMAPRPGEFRTGGEVGDDGMFRGGYAEWTDLGSDAGWQYAPLAWGYNQHFVRPEFGARHTFSLVNSAGPERVVAFCPRDRRAPGLEGTLTIGPDAALRSSRWRYVTRPRAEAGGEADYLPPGRDTQGLLLASRSLFWREMADDVYFFRLDEYREWRIGDEVERQAP